MAGKIRSAVPFLARRFLLSRSSDRFLSFIAWVSVTGVALGVLALTVVTSVINGFENELTQVITRFNGDVILYSRGEPIRDPEKVEAKIKRVLPKTKAITHSLITELMVSGEKGVAGAVLEGVDFSTVAQVTSVTERIIEGTRPTLPGEVALGAFLADRIGVKVGDTLRIIYPEVGAEEGSSGGSAESLGAPRVIPAKVSGIVKMGLHEYDSKFIFAPLKEVQRELKLPGRVTSFKIRLEEGVNARAASNRLTENFGYPFRAKDWGQLNKNLFYAIHHEKAVIAIVLTVIIIVAAFNVVSTLMMMIHDKTKEIAILKAMGLPPSQGFRLFLWIGLGIGFVGIALGVVLGLGINLVLAKTRLIELPAEVYYIGYLPVIVNWREVILIGGTALLVILIATLYPAYQVSRRSPLEGIRYD